VILITPDVMWILKKVYFSSLNSDLPPFATVLEHLTSMPFILYIRAKLKTQLNECVSLDSNNSYSETVTFKISGSFHR